MNYLIKKDDKKNINLDIKKILNLRAMLIKKYAKVIPHYEAKYDANPRKLYKLRGDPFYKNFDICSDPSFTLYDYVYCYDEYQYPLIVNLINELLRGNYKVISKIHSLANGCDEMYAYYRQLESYINIDEKNNSTFETEMSSKKMVNNFIKRLTRKKR